jgi:hypothetical protein
VKLVVALFQGPWADEAALVLWSAGRVEPGGYACRPKPGAG